MQKDSGFKDMKGKKIREGDNLKCINIHKNCEEEKATIILVEKEWRVCVEGYSNQLEGNFNALYWMSQGTMKEVKAEIMPWE